MATGLETKIKEYWSRIENLTLEMIKWVKKDENECHLLLNSNFKQYFVRSANLRVAAVLEQFCIEDQLFGIDSKNNVQQMNDPGDGSNSNTTNSNAANIGESTNSAEAVEREENHGTSNIENDTSVGIESEIVMETSESNKRVEQNGPAADLRFNRAHTCAPPKSPSVAGEFTLTNNDEIISQKYGNDHINVSHDDDHDGRIPWKRERIDSGKETNQRARKKCRMSLDVVENYDHEFMAVTPPRRPPPSRQLPQLFPLLKSHPMLNRPKFTEDELYEYEHNNDSYVDSRGFLIPFVRQKRPQDLPNEMLQEMHVTPYARSRRPRQRENRPAAYYRRSLSDFD